MQNFDVISLGELLIDFPEHGKSAQGNALYEACPGGAPCNVLTLLSKLGKKIAFIGKVGDDSFGHLLEDSILEVGIHADFLIKDPLYPTTLAFVSTLADGDRAFSFYRNPGADMMLRADELPSAESAQAKIFHFGSLSMTHETVREATIEGVNKAKVSGALISFDPNLREALWSDLEAAKEAIAWGLSQCDILKIADNELVFMTGEEAIESGASVLQQRYPNIQVLNVTAGAQGSYSFYHEEEVVFVPAFTLGNTIDTTGAGDTFCASVLATILGLGIDELSVEERRNMLRFANAAAYIVTTRKGALRAMPELSEIEAILNLK